MQRESPTCSPSFSTSVIDVLFLETTGVPGVSSLSPRQLQIQPLIILGDRISCMGLRYSTSSPLVPKGGKMNEMGEKKENGRFLHEGLKHSSVSRVIE
jgi:hypothetical protein